MVDIGSSCAKYLVFIVNFLLTLFGISLVAIGVLVKTKVIENNEFFVAYLTALPIVLIVAGSGLFIVTFFGCCGAIVENTCMLLTFSILMTTVLLAEIGAGVYVYKKKNDIIGESLKYARDNIPNDQSFFAAWNLLQRDLKCCGINEPDDWKAVNDSIYLPPTCCGKPIDDTQSTCIKEQALKLGCKQALIDYVEDHAAPVVAFVGSFGVFQLLGVVLSCCLFSVFRLRNSPS